MSALAERFQQLRDRGEKALVVYVTAGDPGLDELHEILGALIEAGVDAIEIGIPFSDPIADGPTIQGSSQRALDRGVTPSAIFKTLQSAIRNPQSEIPLVLMVYTNTVMRIGLDAFADAAVASGVSGAIVTDLTPEESDDWLAVCRARDLETVFLAAPTSTEDRLKAICSRASGFVYAVSRTGVTGAESTVPADVRSLIERVKAHTPLPVCVGFGVSKPEHVRMVCEVADGAVVGSWLVDLLHREWQNGKGRDRVIEQVRALKAATRS